MDHFPEALDVVVGCARKTEVDRWERLFEVVGSPRELFERCLVLGKWRTAASYLLVLQNLEELDDAKVSLLSYCRKPRLTNEDAIRLLRLAINAKEYHLSKELLRFLHSIDETGAALQQAITEVGIVPDEVDKSAPAIKISESKEGLGPAEPAPPHVMPTPDPDRLARHVHIRNTERVSSPFQLSSPRLYESPPSPRTVIIPGQTPTAGTAGRIPDAPIVPDHEEEGSS